MALKFENFFSTSDQDPFEKIRWERRESRLADAKGRVYHHYQNLEFPSFWSQASVDIATSKYFRRAGVPEPFGHKGAETSLKSLLTRVTSTITKTGLAQGYFETSRDAEIFEKELRTLLVHQKAAFNSPVWFNCGLFHQYGIKGTKTELYSWDNNSKKIKLSHQSYETPQISACFIQSVQADPDEVKKLAENETKLFRFGSGSGTNFSQLPGRHETQNEELRLISVLNMLDQRAGSVKSGGITRRAAKMDCLNDDHPDVIEFVRWKKLEERKLKRLVAAGQSGVFEGEAFQSLMGQNSNNSIRISDRFLSALKNKQLWPLKSPLSGQVTSEIAATELWQEICEAAWECADPGVQFTDTINAWNPCKISGEINASNPCSEYMFLDETACNLASINLAQFYSVETGFDFESYRKAIQILFIAQDIMVDFAGYPTEAIALNSHKFRPLGIGYANLGGLFMRMGFSYDSNEAVEWTHLLTATLQSEAFLTSHLMAEKINAFEAFHENKASYLEVVEKHKKAWEEFVSGLNAFEAEKKNLTQSWERILKACRETGFRNSQLTVIAPTGTIGLFMGCETTGIEPEYSLIKYKQLSGGGVMKFVNTSVRESLLNLDYESHQADEILEYLLKHETIEGAPGLNPVHLKIFDSSHPGKGGQRNLGWQAQLKVVAAAQKFISGAISKTVNLPAETSVEEISDLYLKAHDMGLKSVAIYREGSKASQPVTSALK